MKTPGVQNSGVLPVGPRGLSDGVWFLRVNVQLHAVTLLQTKRAASLGKTKSGPRRGASGAPLWRPGDAAGPPRGVRAVSMSRGGAGSTLTSPSDSREAVMEHQVSFLLPCFSRTIFLFISPLGLPPGIVHRFQMSCSQESKAAEKVSGTPKPKLSVVPASALCAFC